jgi:hypothetical protein
MSASVETQAQYTPEDLLAMPDGKSYELVGGHLVERNTGAESSWVGGRLLSRLNHFAKIQGSDGPFRRTMAISVSLTSLTSFASPMFH